MAREEARDEGEGLSEPKRTLHTPRKASRSRALVVCQSGMRANVLHCVLSTS